MEKSSYISSKTDTLSNYLMLSSLHLIPNHIMIHCDFLLVFFFFDEFCKFFFLYLPVKYNGNNKQFSHP